MIGVADETAQKELGEWESLVPAPVALPLQPLHKVP